jgi:2-dehydropantoate 2-reductase
MRQVPLPKESAYLLIGNGKVSRHFQFYFSKRKIPFFVERFPRVMNSLDKATWEKCNRVLLLVSDDAIEPLYHRLKTEFQEDTVFIHFSGVKTIEGMFGAHPLMTFGEALYDESLYSQIPFIFSSQEVKSFPELFPSLPNPNFSIRKDQRALYHAACVGAGNFPMLIWQELFTLLEQDLSLPKEVMRPYLEQCLRNSLQNPTKNLTGPLVRGDLQTIELHRTALRGKSFLHLYEKFLEWFRARGGVKKESSDVIHS